MQNISRFIFSIFLMIFSSVLYAQTVVPIIDLRQNDASGVPALNGQMVTISGIVTVANQFGSSGPANVQDETAGISVYGSSFANMVQIGDSVTVTGQLTHFNGLSQLDFRVTGSSYVKHSSGNIIETTILDLTDIKNQAWNDIEDLEGLLVRINQITVSGTGNFSSGTNYSISDSTGTLEMRVDNDVSSIIGTPIPTGAFDLVGVIGQFDSSTPYSSGYQIIPRSIGDLLYSDEPFILGSVFASNITPSSFTVYFNTLRKGNSEVLYGLTEDLEIGSVVDDTDTTVHAVTISGLDSLTRYYFKARSTNAAGSSESDIIPVFTTSPNPTTGTINVYFNYGVDHSVSIPGNEAVGLVDFRDKLKNRIFTATYSIDMAVYSFFGLNDVSDALIAAKNRGVKIRVVYDNRDTQNSMQNLVNAGIQLVKRNLTSGIMHNKFAVFDGRNSDLNDDWIWTGSWNWTSTELNWRNNALEINDPSLASAYTKEFEEMWGSDTDIPNPANSKFGTNKTDNTVHDFEIGGKNINMYFSPSDFTENRIIDALGTSDTSIYFALLVFTSDPIYDRIALRHSAGLRDIRGIINDVNVTGSEYPNLQALSGSEMFAYNLGGKLHSKYGLVDPSSVYSQPLVITGSHNWSRAANEDNDENTLIIEDIYIANQFLQEFKKLYNDMGGTTAFTIPIITGHGREIIYPENIELYQNYPNPFNPVTTISFFLPEVSVVNLSVYDMLGQKVEDIYTGRLNAGKSVFDFSPDDLSSGMYIYRLSTDKGVNLSGKMMYIK